jgi:hypothetical protein
MMLSTLVLCFEGGLLQLIGLYLGALVLLPFACTPARAKS